MKLFGALLLLFSCALLGARKAAGYQAKVRRITLLIQLTDSLCAELQGSLPLISELLRKIAKKPSFCSLQFLRDAAEKAETFPECWQTALQADKTLSPDELEILTVIGQTLGSTTLDGQLSALRLCQGRLKDLRERAAEQAKEKGKLCRSLSILFGIFLSILLI